MKLTNFLLGVLVITQIATGAVVITLAQQSKPLHQAVLAQRFQLFNAKYGSISNGNSLEEYSLFKIDLQTGQTWKWLELTSQDKYQEGWTVLGSFNK